MMVERRNRLGYKYINRIKYFHNIRAEFQQVSYVKKISLKNTALALSMVASGFEYRPEEIAQ